MSITTQIDYVVTGLQNLTTAVSKLGEIATAQVGLQKSTNDLMRSMATATTTGVEPLNKSLKETVVVSKSVDDVLKISTTTLKGLADSWRSTGVTITQINAQLTKNVAAVEGTLVKMTQLTTQNNVHIKGMRDLFMQYQANNAAISQLSSAYTKQAAMTGEIINLESGASAAILKSTAATEAKLAVSRASNAVDQLTINSIKQRIIAESELTAAQKLRALQELGIVSLLDDVDASNKKLVSSNKTVTMSYEDRIAGMDKAKTAYASLGTEHSRAIELDKLHTKELGNSVAAHGKLNTAMTGSVVGLQTAQGALRGATAASGALFLSYGALIPTVVAMSAAFGLVSTAISSIKTGAEFEKLSVYIQAVQDPADAVIMSLEGIQQGLLSIKGVGQTPAELATAMKELVKAGISATDSLEAVGTMAKFAAVVETDMAKASELVSSQWQAWSTAAVGAERGVSSMAGIMEVLAAVVVQTKVDMSDLTNAMKQTSALASSSQVTYTEMAAMLGHLGNMGLQGSIGATALKTSILRLQSPTDTVKKMLGELGVEFDAFNANTGKMKGAFDIYTEFFSMLDKLSAKDKSDVLYKALGVRAVLISGVATAVKDASATVKQSFEVIEDSAFAAKGTIIDFSASGSDNILKFEKRLKELSATGGLIGEMFDKISQTTKFKLDEIGAAIDRAMVKAFDSEAMSAAMDGLLETVNSSGFQDLIEAITKGATVMIEAFSALSPAVASVVGYVADKLTTGFLEPIRSIVEIVMEVGRVIADPSSWSISTLQDIFVSVAEFIASELERNVLSALRTVSSYIKDASNWVIKLVVEMDESNGNGGGYARNPLAAAAAKKMGKETGDSFKEGFAESNPKEFMTQSFGSSLETASDTATKYLNTYLEYADYGSQHLLDTNIKVQKEYAALQIKNEAAVQGSYKKLMKDRNDDYQSKVNSYSLDEQKLPQVVGLLAQYKNELYNSEAAIKEVEEAKKKDATASSGSAKANNELAKSTENLGKISASAMPSGYSKALADWANEYKKAVEDVKKSSTLAPEVAKQMLDNMAKEFATGNANRAAEWSAKYKKSVDEIGNSLDKLAGKDASLSKLDAGIIKITEDFDKWGVTAAAALAEINNQKPSDLTEEMKKTKAELEAMIKKAPELEKKMKEAFAAKLVTDFNKELKDLNESFSDDKLSAYDSVLKGINDKYDDMRDKAIEAWDGNKDGIADSTEATGVYNKALADTEAARARAIAQSDELKLKSNNVWDGFIVGVKDAQKEMKSLGELGAEIATELRDGFKEVFVDVIKGDIENIEGTIKDALSGIGDTVIDYIAEGLANKTMDALVEGLSSFAPDLSNLLNGFTERGSAGNPVYTYETNPAVTSGSMGDGSLSSFNADEYTYDYAAAYNDGYNQTTGVGSTIDFKSAGVGLGASAMQQTNYLKVAGGYLGMAAGGYGVYSGVKNMSEGNYGTGALQTGIGAYSMYKGAVAANILTEGAATRAAQYVMTKFAAEEVVKTAAVKTVAAQAAPTAGTKVLGGMTNSGVLTAFAIAATLAKMAHMNNLDPSMNDEFNGRADGSLTARSFESITAPFMDAMGDIEGTTLSTIDRLKGYNKAMYDSSEAALLMTGNGPAIVEMFDSASQSWYSSGQLIGTAAAFFGNTATSVSMDTVSATGNIISSFTGMDTSLADSAGIANLVDAAINAANISLSENADQNNLLASTTSTLTNSLMAMGMTSTEASQAADKLTAAAGGTTAQQNSLSEAMQIAGASSAAMSGSVMSLYDSTGALITQFDTAQYSIQSTTDAITGAANGFEVVSKASDAATSTLSQSASGFTSLSETSAVATEALSTVSGSITEATTAAATAISTLSSSLGGFAVAAGSTADSLRKATNSFDDTVSSGGSRAMGGPIGKVQGFANGGLLKGGSGTRDDLYLGTIGGTRYMAMGGEMVMNRRASRENYATLDAMNKGGAPSSAPQVIHNHFYVDGKEIATTIMPAVDKQVTAQARRGALTKRTAY